MRSCAAFRRDRACTHGAALVYGRVHLCMDAGRSARRRTLKTQLRLAAYEPVSQVARPGEYAIRGSLIDLFPMGAALPYRIDLFDERIDSIRVFDPDTQRSLQPVREVRLLPGREFPFDDKA